MENRNYYVFRAGINPASEPDTECSLDFYETHQKELKQKINKYTLINVSYDGHEQFLWKELFENNTLRQGWGHEGLDMSVLKHFDSKGENFWIKNFIISKQKTGELEEIADDKMWCEIARGRLNILKYMLNMKKGDIVFIPKTWGSDTKNHTMGNNSYFTVATIKDTYYFDYISKYNDFSHAIEVENVRYFEYGKYGITGQNFSPHPYRRAVSIIRKEDVFDRFVSQFYL